MALETLAGITEIDGFRINQDADDFDQGRNQELYYNDEFIIVNNWDNSITFKIQNGPIKENGINGCQVDQLVSVARAIVAGLNEKFPCRENACAITKLDEALMWLEARKKDRVKRGVEGENKA